MPWLEEEVVSHPSPTFFPGAVPTEDSREALRNRSWDKAEGKKGKGSIQGRASLHSNTTQHP